MVRTGIAVTMASALTACGGSAVTDSTKQSSSSASTSRTYNGKTSCTQLRYVGDSISVGMVSPRQVPEAKERLSARLADVGVKQASIDVSGGRAVFEPFQGRPTTLDVLPASSKGYSGCYLMAVGSNDAGNIGAGADRPLRLRIDTVMKRLGGRPTLWPMVASERPGTPYSKANLDAFNRELVAATKRYPNLRVYDWASERDTSWMEGDGIHDRRIGSRERALMYAKALTVAFPQGLPANSKPVVSSVWGKAPAESNAPKLPAAQGDRGTFWAADTANLTHHVSGPKMK